MSKSARTTVPERNRYSEAGDTLIEVLLALIVLGLASVALLIAFSTSISASAQHRNLANYDTVLATATQVTIANIQSQPSLFSCEPLSDYPGYPAGITLPSPYAGKYTVLYAASNPVEYWSTTSESFGPTCVQNEPQLITIYLQGTSYSNSFVVDYPIGSSNALTAGAASQLVFLQQPAGGYAGSPFTTQPIVEILTAGGTPSTVTTDLSPVILTLTQGTGVLSGCSGNEILGVVTFSGCTIGTGGTNFEITANDGLLTPAVSNPFAVNGSTYHLVFTSQPVAAASGVGFSTAPVVSVENSVGATDTSWAGTITLTLSGGALSALPAQTCAFAPNATTITLTALNGTVTMPSGCAFSGGYYYNPSRNPPQTATQYTMAATANPTAPTDAAVPATSNTFAVTSFGQATQIAFTSQPTGVASATAATPFSGQPAVAVEDSFGNVVTSATNPIGLAINSGAQGITLSNCNIPSPTNAGLYIFSGCEGSNWGTNLTLTASSTGLTSATSAKFNITNVATQLLFTTQPVAGDSGSVLAIEPVLTIEDSSNRVVTAATTPIAFNAAVPSSGTMSSCTALVPQSGVITVANCAFAGVVGTPYTIVATSGSLTSLPSSSFTPTGPGPASQLVFATSPVAGVSGTAFTTQPIVNVEDSAGNVVTSSTAVITLTPSGGTLAACSGLTASAGVVTVSNCTFAGVVLTPYTLTAASGSLTSLPSASFSPTYAGVPSQIFLTGCQTAIVTSATCAASATIEDSYGNVETHDNLSVLTFAQVPGGGTVTGLGSPTVVAGVASNTIKGAAQGPVGITVSGDSLTSNTITVTVNAPTTTTLASIPNPSAAGQSFNLSAAVSVATPDTGVPTGNIEFLVNGNAIVVCGGTSGVAVVSGQATCTTSWPSVGTQAITAQYLGNWPAYYLPSTSTALSQVVIMASPTLAVVAPGTGTAGTAIAAANITATLASSSGTNDANIISFKVFGPLTTAPTTCTTGGAAAGTATPTGNGTYATSSPFTPTGAGTYWWYVSSPSDANNNAAVSACGSTMAKTVVAVASPTLAVAAPATGTAGTAIAAANITATLASASGTNDVNAITFTVFGPLTTAPTICTTGGTAAGTATPAGNGSYATNSSFTPSGAGTYWWYVSSPLDTNNSAAVSACGSTMTKTVVAAASPTLTVAAPATGTAGTAIAAANITATLASSSGTNDVNAITFTVFGPLTTAPTTCTTGGTAAGTATPAGNGTHATNSSFTPSGAGTYWWYVSSPSDTNNSAAVSACGSTMTKTVVVAASPTLTVAAPATGTAGTAIAAANITATLASSSGTNDANIITFTVFGPLTTAPTTCTTGGVVVGLATPAGNGTHATNSSFTPSGAGTYWWYVSSPSDTNNSAAVSACGSTMTNTVVAAASPTLTVAAPATGTAGTAIAGANITATLASSSGTNDVNAITFTVFGPLTTAPTTCTTGGTAAGTATPTGNGAYATSTSFTPSVAGTYWWYVSSPSDTNNSAAVSACGSTMTKTVVVAAPVPTLVQQVNTPSSGSVSSLTVTLPSNVTAGDTLILSYASESDGSYAPSSITYSGQTFVKEAGNSAITGYGSSQVWALFNANGGAKTITISLSGSTFVQMADVTEWSGLNGTVGPVSNSSNTTTGTSVTAGSITTAGLDLVISAAYAAGGNGTLPATPGGFTSLSLAMGGSPLYYRGYGAYEIQTAVGAIQATWTQVSAEWSAAVASFGP